MSAVVKGVAEISDFVDAVELNNPLKDANRNKAFSQAYRYVHALMIWDAALNKVAKHKPNADALLHIRELLSDLASHQLLLLSGMYKPARMMLRSSVENILRIVALEQGFLASGAKFTYELITLVKSSKLGAADSPVKADVAAIIACYAHLCAYAHAGSASHMALRVPLATAMAFDKAEFDMVASDLKNLTSRYNRVLYALYNRQLMAGASHSHQDFVLDALPKALKAHFAAGN